MTSTVSRTLSPLFEISTALIVGRTVGAVRAPNPRQVPAPVLLELLDLGGRGDVDDLHELLALASVTFAAASREVRLVNFSF